MRIGGLILGQRVRGGEGGGRADGGGDEFTTFHGEPSFRLGPESGGRDRRESFALTGVDRRSFNPFPAGGRDVSLRAQAAHAISRDRGREE
jgi:hypothetical protein